jgi:hypothetical protein
MIITMVRKTLTLTGASLLAFHIWLFADQVWQGQFVDLALVSRWIIAGALVAALVILQRRGVSIIRGRQAIAVWLLAGLLHGPALTREIDVTAPAMPEVVTTLAQLTTGLTLLGVVLLIGVAGLRRRDISPLRALAALETPALFGALPQGSYLSFAPRPPPY